MNLEVKGGGGEIVCKDGWEKWAWQGMHMHEDPPSSFMLHQSLLWTCVWMQTASTRALAYLKCLMHVKNANTQKHHLGVRASSCIYPRKVFWNAKGEKTQCLLFCGKFPSWVLFNQSDRYVQKINKTLTKISSLQPMFGEGGKGGGSHSYFYCKGFISYSWGWKEQSFRQTVSLSAWCRAPPFSGDGNKSKDKPGDNSTDLLCRIVVRWQ